MEKASYFTFFLVFCTTHTHTRQFLPLGIMIIIIKKNPPKCVYTKTANSLIIFLYIYKYFRTAKALPQQ